MPRGIAEKLSLLLALLDKEYLAKPVRVAVVKDKGRIHVDGVELELRKGIELELPRWLAMVLSDKGIVQSLEQPITINDIARMHFSVVSAHTPAELDPIPQYFYKQVREYYHSLDKRIRESFDASLLEEKNKAATYIAGIVSKRVTLLLHILRSPSTLTEIYPRLAPEEKVLLDALKDILEKWKHEVSGFITE